MLQKSKAEAMLSLDGFIYDSETRKDDGELNYTLKMLKCDHFFEPKLCTFQTVSGRGCLHHEHTRFSWHIQCILQTDCSTYLLQNPLQFGTRKQRLCSLDMR
ncbi:hypothetical protein KP509_1Z282500 [Ceratopteris richardii]|nr:hypothetical protein KP509_1Z282500 [Ceratopteris richardii]